MTRGLAALVLCLAWLGADLHAQTRATTGDLRVIALDESTLILPGVRISLAHAETGLERTAFTGPDGRAMASALAIGRYSLRADLDGFRPVTIDAITIELGATIEVRMTLYLASRTETVDVVAPQPLVDIQRTAVSTVINEQQIAELPIDRRNYISFAVLAAGVATDRTLNQGPAETSGLSFAGQSARANNITVDGLDNNDDATGGVRAVFSQDAVREFQVVAHSYSAEFGKASGGVVNIVTRSGTNRVTADAFGFYRDRGLNSRGYFENFDPSGAAVRLPKAPFKQRQFGGTIGGPLKKNRTFAFASFERLSIRDSAAVTIDDRTVVSHPILTVMLGTAPQILNAAGFHVATGNVPFDVRTTTGLVRIDHVMTAGTNVGLRFNMAEGFNGNSQPFGGIVARSRGGLLENRDYAFAGAVTSVHRRLVNEMRFQIARRDQEVRSLDASCNGPCIDPSQGGPALEIIGVARVGRHNFTPQRRNNIRYQVLDTVSLERGRHLLKAGVDFNLVDNRDVSLPLNFGGQFFFVALAPAQAAAFGLPPMPVSAIQAFALGLPVAYVQGYGDPFGTNRFVDAAMFVQDEWRPKDTLTLRLGARYQKQFWDENSGSGNLDIAPRVAVSWDPVGSGRTSLAAAYGLFFDSQFNAPISAARIANGETLRVVAFQGAPAVQAWRSPGRRLPQDALASAPSLSLAVARHFDVPYTHQYSVTLNRQLASDVFVSVSGIVTRGNRYVSSIDYNPLVASLGPGRRPADLNNVPGTSSSQLQYTPWGESWYRGLLLSATKRMSGGSQAMVVYMLSKAEDSISDFINSPPQDQGRGRDVKNFDGLPVGFDPSRERGPSLQDQRHRFTATAVQELPFGFQASGIFTAGSGRPYNIIAGVDLNGDGDATVSPGPDRARTLPSDPSTSIGRNTGRLPREHRFDARVTKRLKAGPRPTITLTFDLLNALNTTNFTDVNRVFGTGAYPSAPQATFGQFTQAGPPRQLQIGARFSY
jgi:Carboxypeptidase regulatory-like domain/TonB dependent receptor